MSLVPPPTPLVLPMSLQYSPYKKGSKVSKARRARDLGLEEAAVVLLNRPQDLDMRAWVKPGNEGKRHGLTYTNACMHTAFTLSNNNRKDSAFLLTVFGCNEMEYLKGAAKVHEIYSSDAPKFP